MMQSDIREWEALNDQYLFELHIAEIRRWCDYKTTDMLKQIDAMMQSELGRRIKTPSLFAPIQADSPAPIPMSVCHSI